jgi:F420H(2)-dependent quinone reductase
MGLVDRSWPLLRRLMAFHGWVYRASGGRLGHRFPGAPPTLLLEHVGARSGEPRTSPLVYVADGDDVVLVASKGGHPRNPAWYHNLRANPDVTVQIGRERRAVRAREATPGERPRLWAEAVRTYGPYRDYQERTDRQIPLMVLEPRDGPSGADRPATAAGSLAGRPKDATSGG